MCVYMYNRREQSLLRTSRKDMRRVSYISCAHRYIIREGNKR